jgi:hypothetical protein
MSPECRPQAGLHAALGHPCWPGAHLAAAWLAQGPQGGAGRQLASRFTITDPWDLICYNFRAQNPREVS